jgi:hypothetical protein
MTRIGISTIAVLALTVQPSSAVPQRSTPDPEMFFRQDVGLNEDQIAAIRSGLPVATALPPRTPAEVLLFGAIYIHAAS